MKPHCQDLRKLHSEGRIFQLLDQIIVKQSMFEWLEGFAGFVGDVLATFKPAGASVWLFRPAWHTVFVAGCHESTDNITGRDVIRGLPCWFC